MDPLDNLSKARGPHILSVPSWLPLPSGRYLPQVLHCGCRLCRPSRVSRSPSLFARQVPTPHSCPVPSSFPLPFPSPFPVHPPSSSFLRPLSFRPLKHTIYHAILEPATHFPFPTDPHREKIIQSPLHRLRSGASSSTNRRHFCTFIDKFYSWADFSRSRLSAQTNGKGCNGRRSPGFWHHPPRFPLSDCIQKGPNTHSILRQHNSTDRSYCPRSPFPSLCTLSYQSSFPAKLNQRPLDLRCRCQRPYRAVAVARNNPRPSGLLACLRATVDHRRQQPPQRLHRTSPQ